MVRASGIMWLQRLDCHTLERKEFFFSYEVTRKVAKNGIKATEHLWREVCIFYAELWTSHPAETTVRKSHTHTPCPHYSESKWTQHCTNKKCCVGKKYFENHSSR